VTILDEIVQRKKQEIERRKRAVPLDTLMQLPVPEIRDFKKALQKTGISIIAEIKRKSPSAGLIRKDFDPKRIALIYEKTGVSAISVLTDTYYFGGEQEDLTLVKKAVHIPVFRKEFINDSYQIYESRVIGADAILLIAAILDNQSLVGFQDITHKLGMNCLIEVHTEEELERVLEIGPKIIGINNRNLKTLQVDLHTSEKLKKKIPDRILTVSESGIDTKDDIDLIRDAGFDGVLIGESLMRANDIEGKLQSLFPN
jgi:indole-3-glycerol phosphate synthase